MDERSQCETGNHQNPRGEKGSNFLDLDHSTFFQDTSPKAREKKAKVNSWDFIKIKSFFIVKETIDKTKSSPRNGKRYFQMTYLIKG